MKPTATILLLENLSFPLAFRLRYPRTPQQLPYFGPDASCRRLSPEGGGATFPAPSQPPRPRPGPRERSGHALIPQGLQEGPSTTRPAAGQGLGIF